MNPIKLKLIACTPRDLLTKDFIQFQGYCHFAKLPQLTEFIFGKDSPILNTPSTTQHFTKKYALMFEILYSLIYQAEQNQTELPNTERRIRHYKNTLQNIQALYNKLANKNLVPKNLIPAEGSFYYKCKDTDFVSEEYKESAKRFPKVPNELLISYWEKLPQDSYFKSAHQLIECLCILANPLLQQQIERVNQYSLATTSDRPILKSDDSLNLILTELPQLMIFTSELDLSEYAEYRQHLSGTSGGLFP